MKIMFAAVMIFSDNAAYVYWIWYGGGGHGEIRSKAWI